MKMQDTGGAGKVMMYVMPAMILFMSLGLSSALSLYWVVGNVFMVGQTLLLNNPFKFQEEQKAIAAEKKRRARALEKSEKKTRKIILIELLLKCLNHEIITMIFIE